MFSRLFKIFKLGLVSKANVETIPPGPLRWVRVRDLDVRIENAQEVKVIFSGAGAQTTFLSLKKEKFKIFEIK
jgi:hypothetical protein